jgi:hypothetical protein
MSKQRVIVEAVLAGKSAANVVLATMQGLKVSATIEPDSQDMLYAVVDDTVRMLFAVR